MRWPVHWPWANHIKFLIFKQSLIVQKWEEQRISQNLEAFLFSWGRECISEKLTGGFHFPFRNNTICSERYITSRKCSIYKFLCNILKVCARIWRVMHINDRARIWIQAIWLKILYLSLRYLTSSYLNALISSVGMIIELTS